MVRFHTRVCLAFVIAVTAVWFTGCTAGAGNPTSPAAADGSSLQQSTNRDTTKYPIYVVDASTGAGIAGALVTVVASDGPVTTTTSGPHGKTTVDLPSGDTTVELRVLASGYAFYDQFVPLPTKRSDGLIAMMEH